MERSWGARTTKRRLILGIREDFEGFARFPRLERSWGARTTKRKLILGVRDAFEDFARFPRFGMGRENDVKEDFESFARFPRVGKELGRKSDETETNAWSEGGFQRFCEVPDGLKGAGTRERRNGG